jgi:hypothetical protein
MHTKCSIHARAARVVLACGAFCLLAMLLPRAAFAGEAIELPDFNELDIMSAR